MEIKFGDLDIGVWFQFPEDSTIYIKTTYAEAVEFERQIRVTTIDLSAMIVRIDVWISRHRALVAVMCFDELPIGAWFAFDKRIYLKVGDDRVFVFSQSGEYLYTERCPLDMRPCPLTVILRRGRPRWKIVSIILMVVVILLILWLGRN